MVMNEFEARDYILSKRNDMKSLEDIKSLIDIVINNFNYGYGVAPRAAGALCAVIANYLSVSMGLTGFQASFLMWDFIRGFQKRNNLCGMKLVDYDDMLYPQYGYKFEKIISKTTWESLQQSAKNMLENNKDQLTSPRVIKHWESIVNGEVPFGYIVDNK